MSDGRNFFEARANYALWLLNVCDDREAAITQLQEAVRLRPDFAPAHELLAQLRR
jgi:hypothetical protein